jgi:hypothetical protein
MKKSLSLALLLVLVFHAHADTVGIQAGIGVWQPDIEGSFGISEVITAEELGLQGEDANIFYIALEHPVPVLPNIRISRTDLEAKGAGRLLTSILHLKTLRQIICCNKTQDNEAGRSLLGRSRSSSRFRAARSTAGSCDLARRLNQTLGWRSIIVVPLSTSVAQAGRGPSAVLLSQGAAGLSKDSIALCHQVTTLDRASDLYVVSKSNRLPM